MLRRRSSNESGLISATAARESRRRIRRAPGRSPYSDPRRAAGKHVGRLSEHRTSVGAPGAQSPASDRQRRPHAPALELLTRCRSPPPAVAHITAAVTHLPGGSLRSRTPAQRADLDQIPRARIHDLSGRKSSNAGQIAATGCVRRRRLLTAHDSRLDLTVDVSRALPA